VAESEQLVQNIAAFIAAYRSAGRPPADMKGACLEEVPGATGSDFAIGLIAANRVAREGANA